MEFNNFRLNILLRVCLLAAFLLITCWSFIYTDWEVTPLACALIAVFCVMELIHYVEQNNRKLKSFLEFIYHQDFSTNFTEQGLGKSFSDLADAYRLITQSFQRLNEEKQANALFLEAVVEHINVALLCVNNKGEITLMNHQAQSLFNSPYLPKLKALQKVDPQLPAVIDAMKAGEHQLINLTIDNEKRQLSVYTTNFQLLGDQHKLISFQDIGAELEQQEIASWQRLTRVLIHEIMNSVTPIVSLTGVLKEKLLPDSNNTSSLPSLSQDEIKDLQQSIRSIESRSKGLQNFVQTYRKLSTIPSPNIQLVDIDSIVENITTLMTPELEQRSIELQIYGSPTNEKIAVDPEQAEQVLINLIKNSMEALAEIPHPQIQIHLYGGDQDYLQLQVLDNGPGISEEYLDQIFMPFFTTKQNGTGIGLSISRQLMIQNRGALLVTSKPGHCSFTMRLRKGP